MNLQEVSFIAPCTSSGADRRLSGAENGNLGVIKIFGDDFLLPKFLLPRTVRRKMEFPPPFESRHT